jgi:hypothetical protein
MPAQIFQQRYQSDKGWITIQQEGLDPSEGEAVFDEEGQPLADGTYHINTAEKDRYIEVREGIILFYHQRQRETDIGKGNTLIILILLVVVLFILFRVLGRQP